jgi:lipoprotein NlpI
MIRMAPCWLALLILVVRSISRADEPLPTAELLVRAKQEFESGRQQEALRIVTGAIKQDQGNIAALMLRASIHDRLRQHVQAIADYDRIIELAPDNASVFHARGSSRFKGGDVKGSIADFDREIGLEPNSERRHWQRGLSYYYDGQYAQGAKQFELYQTYDASDVENVVWRYLCQAKVDGVEKARADMLPLANSDGRVPMMKIYDLYLGRAAPQDVLARAQSGEPSETELTHRLFYAHLYLALYYESIGDTENLRKQMFEAEKLEISHYMWDVAKVHADMLIESKE